MMNRIRNMDFYRKIPKDLTEGTFSGGGLSVAGAVFMVILFVLELNNYMTINNMSRIVMDDSNDDMLQINFNITLPKLPCEYASVDVSDVLGTHRVNLTKNIRKWRVGENGEQRLEEVHADPVEIVSQKMEVHERVHKEGEQISTQLVDATFDDFVKGTELTLINFYAPWCIWSQRLQPVWEHTAGILENKPYGRVVKLAKVDCTDPKAQPRCQKSHINAFPSVLVFRDGKTHSHEAYHSDRTADALIKFIEGLRKDKGLPAPDPNVVKVVEKEVPATLPKASPGPKGCMIAGSVLVRKIPGNLVFTAASKSHSFTRELIDTSHIVHHFAYGNELTKREIGVLPESALSNRLDGLDFHSKLQNCTHEHYIKVVSTRYEYLRRASVNTYQYTVNSHVYQDHVTHEMPAAKFTFDLSPMSVVVSQTSTPFYKFLTSLCAIIGGVFTVIGLVDSVVYHGIASWAKKNSLGKAI